MFKRARLYITLILMAGVPVIGLIALITYDGN